MQKCRVSFIFILLLGMSSVKISAQKNQPNIIFIFADDLGWGDLSCYGGDRMKTPGLDKMAEQGTLFTQFYVAGSVCSPSRAGIMAGQYPSRNRIFGHIASKMNEERKMPDALDPDLFMLTDMMKQAGYTTGHFGKWHLGNISPAEYGIDQYATNEYSSLPDEEKISGWLPENRPHCTRDVLQKTLDFIRESNGKPFYVNAWLFDMHGTLSPSKEQLHAVSKYRPHHNPEINNAGEVQFYGVEQVYLAALKNMDNEIGLFLEELDKLGLSRNTLVIFSSDNGPEDYQLKDAAHSGVGSNGPFRGRKRSIYEGGIRVPFILKWPGTVPSETVNTESVICGVDFIPTIASIAGIRLPKDIQALDGENMKDVWLGDNRKREQNLYWEWRYNVFGHRLNRSPMIAMREGDFKILVNPDGSRVELYNIIKDPSELYNLAYTRPKRAEEMKQKAMAWYKDIPQSPWRKNAGKNDWKWPE